VILQSLHALHTRLRTDPGYELPEPGFSLQKITYKVVLYPDGRLFGIEDARILVDGKLRPRQLRVPGVTKPSGSGLNPCLLWDNPAYMLGFEPDEKKRQKKRERKAFAAFRERHRALREEVDSPGFHAVCAFLETWDPGRAAEFPALTEAAKTGFGVFQILGQPSWVHEEPRILAWWERSQAALDASPVVGQCLLTGEEAPLARLHDKVKNLAGGQGSGSSLVGFNAEAFESYGKEQSFNAPVSEQAALRYMTALNALLDGPKREKHRLILGDMTIAFWTDAPSTTEDIFARFAMEGSSLLDQSESQDEGLRSRLEVFLRAMRRGKEAYGELEEEPDRTRFYLLGLSPNAGRVAVRFFQSDTLGTLLDNLRQHHRDIAIVRRPAAGKFAGDPEFPSLRLLLDQTARTREDIPPLLGGPLLRSVVSGYPYPDALFAAVMRRIRADGRLDYPRACVLKGYLNRNLRMEVSMSLDTERPDPAYRLGRLFAALEKTQKDALGEGLNRTIRDSYYAAASATPRVAFPRLLRLYQHHLGKLDGGWRIARERLIQEILAPLDGFPAHLGLAEQGLFAIGYYHQTRDFYTKRGETAADSTDGGAQE
jgi:CRISPR-associated protein Csd1